jgi:hypothetical protein
MPEIDQRVQTLTEADEDKIRTIIRQEVGGDVSMVKQELLGLPPDFKGGMKLSLAMAWQKINATTTWRNLITGGLIVVNVLMLVFGALLMSKVDEVLTFAAVAKADREKIQRDLDKRESKEHKP